MNHSKEIRKIDKLINPEKYINNARLSLIKNILAGKRVNKENIIKYNITINDFFVDKRTPELINFMNNIYELKYKDEYNDICNIFDTLYSNKKITKATKENYISKLKKILMLFNVDTFPLSLNANEIIQKIKQEYGKSYLDYLTVICSLIKYSDKYKQIITNANCKIYSDFMNENLKIYRQNIISKTDIKLKFAYSDIIQQLKELKKKDDCSIKYLLLYLMVSLPPFRDNYGNVLIVDNKFTSTTDNYYCNTNGNLIINNYKTSKYYGQINIILPKQIQTLINKSLKKYPRKYLITSQNDVTKPYKTGKLSQEFPKWYNLLNINDIRHAFETALNKFRSEFSPEEIIQIYKLIGHNPATGILYLRKGKEENGEKLTDEDMLKILDKTKIISNDIITSIHKKIIKFLW